MARSLSLRRYAIDKAVTAARDPNIDAETKGKLLQFINDTAIGPSVYGRLVYRLIAISLGLVAILVVIFSFTLLLGKHLVDSAFYTLGSGAIGALGGVLAPQSGGGTTTSGSTTSSVPANTGDVSGAASASSGEAGSAPAAPGS